MVKREFTIGKATVNEWLSGLGDERRPIVQTLLQIIRRTMPGATEYVDHHALGYGPTSSPNDRVIYVAAYRAQMNLGFFIGGSLNDPENLLLGTGKRMHHIKIRSDTDAANTAIVSLLTQAWANRAVEVKT